MYLIAIGWMFVVVLMSAAEAMSPVGSVLGAIVTFFLYGVMPLSIVLYLLGTPSRRRARLKREAGSAHPESAHPDGSGHAAGNAVAPERKEP
jgi:membrane protein implicated in regulation of membrane protease activity